MRINPKTLALSISLCIVTPLGPFGTALAGDLEPPGDPAPTMKSLDEIESRTPIREADLPLTINQPGSYYLVEDIVTAGSGIVITAPNVTIDLKGFSLSAATGDCIRADIGSSNLTVKNGVVMSCGETGVNLAVPANSTVRAVLARANGLHGIRVGPNSIVIDSAADSNGGWGITARDGSLVVQSAARLNAGGGISLVNGSSARDCVASGNGGDGFSGSESRIEGGLAYGNSGDGIEVQGDCYVVGNLCDGNAGAGILATITDNRIDSNTLTDNSFGIRVVQIANVIVRNTASGNGTNYAIVGGNSFGEILDVAASTITTSNPWANFEF